MRFIIWQGGNCMDESSRTLQCVIGLVIVYHFRAVIRKLQEVN